MWTKLQHPQPEKGLLIVPPNASHGMGQGPEKLFDGVFYFIANKEIAGFVCAPVGIRKPRWNESCMELADVV